MWEAAQQVNARFPCSQDLEDMETKAPLRPGGQEAETSGKVIGLGPCQSMQGWGKGASSLESGKKRGRYSYGQVQCPLGITSSPPRCPLSCLGCLGVSGTPRCSEQA